MPAWKEHMNKIDAWNADLTNRPHEVYEEDPYVLVFKDEKHEGIWHLCFNVNQGSTSAWMHLIEGSEKALLIDTAFGIGNLKALAEKLTGKPVICANTHFHGDHSAGNGQFDAIYCHEYDVPYMELQRNPNGRRFLPPADLFREEDLAPVGGYEIIGVKEGFFFDLGDGDRIEVIHMPGHAAGGCMFLDHKTHLLFSGDAILATPTLIIDRFPNPYNGEYMTITAFRDALARFLPRACEVEAIYSGHGVQGVDNGYLQEMYDCLNAIIADPEVYDTYDYVDDPAQKQIKCVGRAMVVYSTSRVKSE